MRAEGKEIGARVKEQCKGLLARFYGMDTPAKFTTRKHTNHQDFLLCFLQSVWVLQGLTERGGG